MFGLLLAGSSAKLSAAIGADPVGALTTLLPTWFLVPFAIVAVLGLVGGSVLDIYSSGLALLSLGPADPALRRGAHRRHRDGRSAPSTWCSWPTTSSSQFQGFLITLGVPIAAWCGVMLADVMLRHKDYSEPELYDPRGRYGDIRLALAGHRRGRDRGGLGPGHQHRRQLAHLAGLPARPAGPGRQDRRVGLREPGRARRPGDRVRRRVGVRHRTGPGSGVPARARPGRGHRPLSRPAGCLAVIDMQRVFAEPGSAWLTPRFGEIVKPVRDLVAAFGPDVVFTRFVAPATPAGAWRRYYEAWPFALQPPDARIYELVDEFAVGAGPTVDTTTFSKWGPELAEPGRSRRTSWCWPG